MAALANESRSWLVFLLLPLPPVGYLQQSIMVTLLKRDHGLSLLCCISYAAQAIAHVLTLVTICVVSSPLSLRTHLLNFPFFQVTPNQQDLFALSQTCQPRSCPKILVIVLLSWTLFAQISAWFTIHFSISFRALFSVILSLRHSDQAT